MEWNINPDIYRLRTVNVEDLYKLGFTQCEDFKVHYRLSDSLIVSFSEVGDVTIYLYNHKTMTGKFTRKQLQTILSTLKYE